jgi:hypothetical protein
VRYRFDGQELQRRRVAAGKDPAALAADVCRSAEAVRGYERGSHFPPVRVLVALCAELGCQPADLFVAADE